MFKKGQSGNVKGRPTGAKDKKQNDIKKAFQSIVEGNLQNIEKWLKDVATDNPAKGLEMVLRMSEFVLPKMKATDISLDDINSRPPIQIVVQTEECKRNIERLGEDLRSGRQPYNREPDKEGYSEHNGVIRFTPPK